MINPFADLGRKGKIKGESVEGSFACQTPKCYNVSLEARYIEDKKILTWECKDEHISRIEGFELYG